MACNCSSKNCSPMSYTPPPVRQGTTFSLQITVTQGTPPAALDLSLATVTGRIGTAQEVLKNLAESGGGIVVGTGGVISIRVEASETMNWRPGKHPYSILMAFADSTVVEAVYGYILVQKRN